MVTNDPTTFIKFEVFRTFGVFRCLFPPPHTLHINYRVREPHVSHTGINVYAHCPLHLPKKVTEKPSVNHIGSSTSHQIYSYFYSFYSKKLKPVSSSIVDSAGICIAVDEVNELLDFSSHYTGITV